MALPALYVVVPVFNEADNVSRLVGSLTQLQERVAGEFRLQVLVVDDGSQDATAAQFAAHRGSLSLELLRHPQNAGPGAAFATAFERLAALVAPDDWIATMEGDNTSRIDTLLHMLTRRKEGYDVVLASAYSYGGGLQGTPAWRKFLSHAANELALSALRLYGLRTLSSFFRLHSAKMLVRLQGVFGPSIVESRGFEWALEMLYKMALMDARMSEVETLVNWQLRTGVSKMRTFRTIRGYLRVLRTHNAWKIRALSHQRGEPTAP